MCFYFRLFFSFGSMVRKIEEYSKRYCFVRTIILQFLFPLFGLASTASIGLSTRVTGSGSATIIISAFMTLLETRLLISTSSAGIVITVRSAVLTIVTCIEMCYAIFWIIETCIIRSFERSTIFQMTNNHFFLVFLLPCGDQPPCTREFPPRLYWWPPLLCCDWNWLELLALLLNPRDVPWSWCWLLLFWKFLCCWGLWLL